MSLLDHAPHFHIEDATRLARELYGIQATASMLPSERDQNFLLQTQAGQSFVLKIANATEDSAMLDAQIEAMSCVNRRAKLCQQVVPARDGRALTSIQSREGKNHFVWMASYLAGVPFGSLRRHSPELLFDLGRAMGRLDTALADFDHPAIHRDFHWDIANGLRVIRQREGLISDSQMRQLVIRISDDFEQTVAPLLRDFRLSAIHNDANDYNIIVGGNACLRNQTIAGVIDFGDMVYSYTIADLAVAIAYALLDKSDPLSAAAAIVKGYHSERAISDQEIAALWHLVLMRLAMSVAIAADQRQRQPDNDYLAISQQPIRNTLPRLADIHPRFAAAVFRRACGLKPASEEVTRWLRANAQTFVSVIDEDLRRSPLVVFDLSVSSPLISGDAKQNTEPAMTAKLFGAMAEAGAKVGIGRYDEPRLIYTSPAFTTDAEPRAIHLGIDLFAEAGTTVYAPLAGIVHAFADNDEPQDYGPVIILRHETDEGREFYTLYGHLSRESLDGLSRGKAIERGERLAEIGTAGVNGGWPPHLHFQIIADLFDLDCDFPGVARASEREVWRGISPDPNLILGIPEARFPAREPSKQETLAARRKRIGKNLSVAYREPVKIVRGWMQYLWDEEGRRYLDAYNNVPHVGHCHPRVVRAACEQMSLLNTNTRYLHDAINRYAEKLCATLPDRLSVCFFVNSASEANELALRLARAYTGARDMIALEGAYHGHTTSLIDLSPYKHDGPGGAGAPAWVHTAPLPDTFRGPFKRDDPQAGEKYAARVREITRRVQQRGARLAGFIAESLPSVAGQIVFPPGYLASVYEAVREAGGVCIADEVQTGLGRTGTHFWGFESQGVAPDIVVLGKPIGNGHPIGAVITTEEIAAKFDNGMEFFSTFGGNTVSCAIGLAVLDVVIEERLQSHALRVGNRMIEGLRRLMERYSIIGDVRGSGFFLGVELARDSVTLEPAREEASLIADRMRELGILIGTDGTLHNVLKIRPPMPFSDTDADFLLAALDKILMEDFEDR
ncbi:MAG: aminotransferase class III-fold pyridoxal phosphate-dependent enzyme [Acidobacteriota bacterium]